MKISLLMIVLLGQSVAARADDVAFNAALFAKFQVKACTKCHDFFESKLGGLFFRDHKDRTADMCVYCHTRDVTGFAHEDDWFARPGLYTSGMNARQTCEAMKTAVNAKFKNETLIARELEKHLLEDPRVLWAIEGATPKSGRLPEDKAEVDLVKGGLREWKKLVQAWIKGGMKCE